MLWYAFDFPVSLGSAPAENFLRDNLNFDTLYVLGFGFYFLVFGGLQYFVVVGAMGGLCSRILRSDKTGDAHGNQTKSG